MNKISPLNRPEGSRSFKRSTSINTPVVTETQIRTFLRNSEKFIGGQTYIPSASPRSFFLQYANCHRLQRLLLHETLEFLKDVGCPYPEKKTYGLEPFIQVFLWEVVSNYPEEKPSGAELHYLFTFEWSRVKEAFFDEGESVPQSFLGSYRDCCNRIISTMFPYLEEHRKIAMVMGSGRPEDIPSGVISKHQIFDEDGFPNMEMLAEDPVAERMFRYFESQKPIFIK